MRKSSIPPFKPKGRSKKSADEGRSVVGKVVGELSQATRSVHSGLRGKIGSGSLQHSMSSARPAGSGFGDNAQIDGAILVDEKLQSISTYTPNDVGEQA